MKKILLLFVLFAFVKANLFGQDLPPVSNPFNLQSLTVGSYVIPMDNANQNVPGSFNYRAYGLIVHLLNNNVKIKWVIKPGKIKTSSTDAIDFSATASRVKPTVIAASSRDFRTGPFVIFAADLPANIGTLIDNFNDVLAVGERVAVYQTTSTVNVDIRYDLTGFKPRAAILRDGSNHLIHRDYFTTCAIPVTSDSLNFKTSDGADLLVNCFTFASEPHNKPNNAKQQEEVDVVVANIRTFIQNGGNFLAQCEGIKAYENSVNGHFHSTAGIFHGDAAVVDFTTNNNETVAATSTIYPNADLSFSQYEGQFDINRNGSLQNWKLATGSVFQNAEHNHATGGTLATQVPIGASVAKLTDADKRGGMVFYVGNHRFTNNGNIDDIQGLRMYMNAYLTPTDLLGSLQFAAVLVPQNNLIPTKVFCSSHGGPSAAYPLKFELFEDFGLPGPTIGDLSVISTTNPLIIAGSGPSVFQINAPFDPSRSFHNYYVKISPASGCLEPIYRTFAAGSTLPVSLKTFTAARLHQSSTVNLKWTTSTEINNAGFDVQRNLGNNNWQTVVFVPSQALNGNSSADITYTYNDENSSNSVSQYRLRQVDIDNRPEFSEIRSVRGLDQKGGIIIYPNPSNDGKVNVVFEDKNSVRNLFLMDMSGRMVKQMKNISTGSIQIDNLTPGMYSLRIVVPASDEQTVEKIVVYKR